MPGHLSLRSFWPLPLWPLIILILIKLTKEAFLGLHKKSTGGLPISLFDKVFVILLYYFFVMLSQTFMSWDVDMDTWTKSMLSYLFSTLFCSEYLLSAFLFLWKCMRLARWWFYWSSLNNSFFFLMWMLYCLNREILVSNYLKVEIKYWH